MDKGKGAWRCSENSNLEACENKQSRSDQKHRRTAQDGHPAVRKKCLQAGDCVCHFPRVVEEYTTNTREGRFILSHISETINPCWAGDRHRGCGGWNHSDGSLWQGLFTS